MGRKGNWFSSVKKALSPDSKEKKEQKSSTSKKKWFGKQKLETSVSYLEADKPPPPPLIPPPEEIKLTDFENEISHDHDHVVEVATAMDAEEPVPSVQIEPVRVEAAPIACFAGKPKDEVAAIKIQRRKGFKVVDHRLIPPPASKTEVCGDTSESNQRAKYLNCSAH